MRVKHKIWTENRWPAQNLVAGRKGLCYTAGANKERQGSIGMGPMLCLPRETSLTPRSRSKPRTRAGVDGVFLWALGGRPGDAQRHASAATDHPRTYLPIEGPAAPPRNFPKETHSITAMPSRGRVCGFRSTMASEEVTSNATHEPPRLKPGTCAPSPKEGPADPGPRSRPDDCHLPEDLCPRALSIQFGDPHRMRTRHPCQKAFHLAANMPSNRGFLRQPNRKFHPKVQPTTRPSKEPSRLRVQFEY